MQKISHARYRFPPVIIWHAVWLYFRFPLGDRDVEDLLAERGIDVSYETVRRRALKFGQAYARRLRTPRPRPDARERGIDICHETVRYWWNRFGPLFAAELRKKRIDRRNWSNWRWHLDEVFVRINGETHYLWRAVDHEGEVLEVYATKRRDRRAALEFLKQAMKRYGRPATIVTDRLKSYRAAMKVIGNAAAQTCGRWLNNRAENSHQPFRRREGAMARFRDIKTLQKFASIHASIHNHFNHQRHINRRDTFKQARAAALAEWRQLAA